MSKEIKNITWRQLFKFCAKLQEEGLLDNEVVVFDGESAMMVIAEQQIENIYVGEGADDVYDEKAFREAIEHGEINEEDYRLQPKGFPYLTTEI